MSSPSTGRSHYSLSQASGHPRYHQFPKAAWLAAVAAEVSSRPDDRSGQGESQSWLRLQVKEQSWTRNLILRQQIKMLRRRAENGTSMSGQEPSTDGSTKRSANGYQHARGIVLDEQHHMVVSDPWSVSLLGSSDDGENWARYCDDATRFGATLMVLIQILRVRADASAARIGPARACLDQ
jgi:hypothetical protein